MKNEVAMLIVCNSPVCKSQPEDVVSVEDGWVRGEEEDHVTDVKLYQTNLWPVKENRICDILAGHLCICVCVYLCVCVFVWRDKVLIDGGRYVDR